MAAVQWTGGKCKSMQQIKAWFRHNDPESRKEMHHTNPDINPDMTQHNFTYRGMDYQQMCDAFDKRLSETDIGRVQHGENQGRVYMQSILVYLPAGLANASMDDKRRWFRRAGDILDAEFGQNLIDMQVDMDEVHTYKDAETGEDRISREHGHARLFTEVDGRLNAKKFSSRAAINHLNMELHKMTELEFGCPYMDGSKRKGRKTVEDLKAASAAKEITDAAEVQAQGIIAQAEAEAERMRMVAEQYKRAAEANNRDLMRRIADQKEQQAELNRERDALAVMRSQMDDEQKDAHREAQELVEGAKDRARVIIYRAEQEALKTAQNAAEVLSGCEALAAELTDAQRQRRAALDAQRRRIAAQAEAVMRNQGQGPDEPSPS